MCVFNSLLFVIFCLFFFFFQAEDGIRDTSVTGVQTCALPISMNTGMRPKTGHPVRKTGAVAGDVAAHARSEERRVGKECRSRGAPEQQKEKRKNIRRVV